MIDGVLQVSSDSLIFFEPNYAQPYRTVALTWSLDLRTLCPSFGAVLR